MSQYVSYDYMPPGLGVLGADEVDVSQFTEEEALKKAGLRLSHVVSQIQALEAMEIPWPLPKGIEYSQVSVLAAQTASLRKRVSTYAQTIANALPTTGKKLLLTVGTAGLYPLGVGIKRVFGVGISPTGMMGTEVFQKVLAFEDEADKIRKKVESLLNTSIPGARKLPPPKKGREEKSLTDLAWDLLWIGTIGLGVWYGGKLLYQYLDEKTRYPAKRLPRYAGGKRRR